MLHTRLATQWAKTIYHQSTN